MPDVSGPGNSERDQIHAHTLGPHVVGQRVVVRRVLHGQTGPTGGPAFSDVLGVCESWGDGRVTVRREDDSVVEIATADIVSGKPVPPRPSARARVSIRDAESHAAPLWPQVARTPLGEWELRLDPAPAGRPLKRANSCLAIGDPGRPIGDAVDEVVHFYRSHQRTPMVQVEAESPVETAFVDSGWTVVPGGESVLLLGSLDRISRDLGRLHDRRRLDDRAIDLTTDGPRATASCVIGEVPAGTSSAAHDGDWLGIHSLLVDPAHRRQGIATALMARLLEFGAENGCLTVWLHVEVDNAPALGLYESLGLVAHHRCRYLSEGDGVGGTQRTAATGA